MRKYDVIVIGGGPGGYVAAIRAAQLGLKTACIDKQVDHDGKPVLGGTCLNVGCIPSKALLDSSHQYEFMNKHASEHGISGEVSIDISKLQERKGRVVKNLTRGVAGLLKKNKVDWLKGTGSFLSPTEIKFTDSAGKHVSLHAQNVIIATGSLPTKIPSLPIDNKFIFDSSGALDFESTPSNLCIIGAGVIGLELGSVWRRLGAAVTILEALPNFLGPADEAVSKEALKIFKKQGLKIKLDSLVTDSKRSGDEVKIGYESNGKKETESFDKIVVAVGRSPYTENLNLQSVGIEVDQNGFILTNNFNQTTINNIYAIGDCVPGPMLAHKASEEGILVAEKILGSKASIHIDNVPWIIYTWPEIAWVGQTEKSLKESGRNVRCGQFPFLASGRSHARGETEGFVKIIADRDKDQVLGVHIIGANASELISEAVTAMEFGASSEDIARTIHGHPTLSESLHEAALAASGRAIHF